MATPDRSYRRCRSWNDDIDDNGHDALLDYTPSETSTKKPRCASFWTCILAIVAVLVLFLLGFCLGYYVRESLNSIEIQSFDCASYRKDKFNDSKLEVVHERIMYHLSSDTPKLVKFVSDFGNADPIYHSVSEKKLEQTVEQEFEDYSFDSVNIQEYSNVVTYPDSGKPNRLEVLDSEGAVLGNFSLENSSGNKEGKTANVSSSGPYTKFPFVAYTLGGTAKGGLLYGHYGRESDLLTLKGNGLDPKGHILLVRLGTISVAEKLQFAETAGVAGVLLYWDPAERDVAAPVNKSFIPYASAGSDDPSLFSLPTQTVSASIAAWLLGRIRGESASSGWNGGFNITYRYGTGNLTVQVTTYNKRREVYVRNVIGSLHGYSEPDSYVVIGAPRSSFPGSSTDALSSTAMLVHLARSLVYIQKRDQWKPRRGIKLISWGGAEFSNAGMREYIKSNSHLLGRRAVAYFDLSELALGNQTVTATVTPALRNLLRTAAHRVPNPLNPETMVLDAWDEKAMSESRHWTPFKLYTNDVTRYPFLHMLGVPVIHLQFEGPNEYDSSVDRMRDLDTHHHFKYHIAVSRIATLAMLKLVDDYVLPYSIKDYADSLHVAVWQTSESLRECSEGYMDLGPELTLTDHLAQTASAFDDFIKIYRQKQDVLGVKYVNDVKILFERIFVTKSFARRFSSQHILYPVLHDDSSIDTVQELCRVATKSIHWDNVNIFQERLYSVLHETFKSLRN